MSGPGTGRALALLLGAAGLAAHAAWRPRLEERQVALGLVLPAADGRGLAADVAVPTLALGALRGLAVDWLWMRSLGLRDQGRHYEARQIAEQLCRLQPRIPDAWAYLAHDLAYNVSAAVSEPRARWRWVTNGVELLRDQGLRYNPGDVDLYFTLARIYQDKVGSATDDHHTAFKRLQTELMHAALGEATPAALLAAPDGLAAAAAQDPEVARLVEALRAAGLDPHEALLPPAPSGPAPPPGAEAPGAPGAPGAEGAREVVEGLAATPAWARARLAARRDALRRLGLDPAVMAELDARYGPLDWRGCDALSVYWAALGVRAAERRPDRPRQRWGLERTVAAALRNAVRRGRVEVFPSGDIIYTPQPELIGPVDRAMAASIAAADAVVAASPPEGARTPAEEEAYDAAFVFARNQRLTRESFLGEATLTLTEFGRDGAARRLYEGARREFPLAFPTDYDAFIRDIMLQRFADPGTYDTPAGITQLLEGTWRTAYEALAAGQDERFAGLDRLARASARRWEAHLRTRLAEEPEAFRRLGVDAEAVRRRALEVAARTVPAALRERLAERLGVPVERLLAPAAPPGGTPPGAAPPGGRP